MTTKRLPLYWISLSAGLLFLCVSSVGLLQETKATLQSYLFSFLFWSDLPLGSIPLIMIYHLTGGNWGLPTRRILEALSSTVTAVAILFLPILIGIQHIYPWMDPQIASQPKIHHKTLYLNSVSFSIRTLIYFACWLALNSFLLRKSKSSEHPLDTHSLAKLRSVSAGGLVLVGLIASFASIDWQMSVEPEWYSTIYGMIYITGQSLSSYSFALFIFGIVTHNNKAWQLPKSTLQDLGNILLTLVMLWAYLSFMQYLIIWSGNLPHEVSWYNHRTQGGWQWLGVFLIVFQFIAPFILLLFRFTKNHSTRLSILGGMIFLVRIIDHYWMLIPGLKPEHLEVPWQAFSTWLGIGSLCLASFIRHFDVATYREVHSNA